MRGVQHSTIATSASVSGAFDLRNAKSAVLSVPVVTSGILYMQVSPTATAADFRRLYLESGSLYQLAVAAGSVAVILPAVGGYAKFETSVAQAGVRSLAIIAAL